jgi:hypothetical protein
MVKTAAWYNTRLIVAPLVLALGLTPAMALAQSAPPALPSYAVPPAAPPAPPPVDQETIHGSIASIDNNNGLQLNDDRGFVDSVRIQQNTIINPGGTQLAPGMVVTIGGAAQGSVFAANHIDVAISGPAAPAPPAAPAAPAPPMLAPQGPPQNAGAFVQPPPQQSDDGYVQPPPVPLKPGMEFTGILGTSLDSKTVTVGEPVDLTNVTAANGSINGASLLGTVVDVQHPGPGRNAQIMLIVVSMQIKTKSNAAKEVGGALVGMIVGNAIGKALLGVSGGGIVGAFGGYLVAKDDRTDITIPANTGVTVRLVHERRQAVSGQ